MICGISIRIGAEWVTKWDGAENTELESVKGGLSASMRRAAVQWGVGRYLYRLPRVWVPVDEKGRAVRTPSLPPDYHGLGGASARTASSGDGQGGGGRESPRLEPYVLIRSDQGNIRAKAS